MDLCAEVRREPRPNGTFFYSVILCGYHIYRFDSLVIADVVVDNINKAIQLASDRRTM